MRCYFQIQPSFFLRSASELNVFLDLIVTSLLIHAPVDLSKLLWEVALNMLLYCCGGSLEENVFVEIVKSRVREWLRIGFGEKLHFIWHAWHAFGNIVDPRTGLEHVQLIVFTPTVLRRANHPAGPHCDFGACSQWTGAALVVRVEGISGESSNTIRAGVIVEVLRASPAEFICGRIVVIADKACGSTLGVRDVWVRCWAAHRHSIGRLGVIAVVLIVWHCLS